MAKNGEEWLMARKLGLAGRIIFALVIFGGGAWSYLSLDGAGAGLTVFVICALLGFLLLCKKTVDLTPKGFNPKAVTWSPVTPEGLKAAAEALVRHTPVKVRRLPAWAVILVTAALLAAVTALLYRVDRHLCTVAQVLCFYILTLNTGGVKDWCPDAFLLPAAQQDALLSLRDRYKGRMVFSSQIACDNAYSIPVNVKTTIKPRECPEGFYGIQAQTNEVMFSPYTYFVIVAKDDLGLKKAFKALKESEMEDPFALALLKSRRYKKEAKTQDGVDCIIITLESGVRDDYTTSVCDVLNMAEGAIGLTEELLRLL